MFKKELGKVLTKSHAKKFWYLIDTYGNMHMPFYTKLK